MSTDETVIPVSLDRSSPVPLYFQLAEQLMAAITGGSAQPGDLVENEVAMSKRLGLSRPTVRYAIRYLVDQGLLVRKRGLGTFITSRRVHRRVSKGSLYEDLSNQGRSPSTKVLGQSTGRNPKAAVALELDPDTDLIALKRLRYADGETLTIMHNWLPTRFGPISDDDLVQRGLYSILHDHGVGPIVVHQSISARLPTTEESEILEITNRLPVITVRRTAFQPGGAAVEYAEHVYRSDNYEIDLVLEEN